MPKSFKWLCLIAFVVLSACAKEDPEPVYTHNSGLLYQYKFNDEYYYEYTYNDLNQIAEEKSKWHYIRHNYLKGRLVSSDYYYDPNIISSSSDAVSLAMNRKEWVNPKNTVKDNTNTYSYDSDGRIIKSENKNWIIEFSYDTKNRITRQTFYYDNVRSGYNDFSYDDNGNVIKKLNYLILANGNAELQTTTEYEFDNKKNPYKAFNTLITPGENTNTNNITRETYTIHFEVDPFIQKVQTTKNSYEYNSKGFPVSKNGTQTYVYY